jgi:predicted metal-dependent peptidase
VIQPAVDFLIDKKLASNPTVILTDGYTDALDLSKFDKVLIVTNANEMPVAKMPRKLTRKSVENSEKH